MPTSHIPGVDRPSAFAPTFTAYADRTRAVYHGPDATAAARAAQAVLADGSAHAAILFYDGTGLYTEVDPTEPPGAPGARLAPPDALPDAAPSGPGRPKLGVVSREVSLLPRHWAWLATQRGGASAVLRRLVDEARQAEGSVADVRAARDAAYHVMSQLAGDAPHFEAASRALYAGKLGEARALALGSGWPPDVAAHVARLLDVATLAAGMSEA